MKTKKQNNISFINLSFDEIEEGDLIINIDSTQCYVVLWVGESWIYKHKYIDCIWNDGRTLRLFKFDGKDKRKVLRFKQEKEL
jgi:hypothetical protein